MSLNEIYDDPVNGCVKTWQNYRFNNLNILDKFNIDTTGAAPGDILELDAGLDPTWVPFSNIPTSVLDSAIFSIGTTSISTAVTPSQIFFSSINSSGSIFTLNGGNVVIHANCTLMLFLNITSAPSSTSYPIFQLFRFRGIFNPIITSLMNISPYRTTLAADTPWTRCSAFIPVQCLANDILNLSGILSLPTSTTSTSIISAESSLTIMRIA